MIVFAWILWSLLIINWTVSFAVIIGKVAAINEGRRFQHQANLIHFLLHIAIFVFLSILIFGGYLQ